MANMLSPFKRKVSLALKIETIARLDQKAKEDNSTRNAVAEHVLDSVLAKVKLTPEAIAEIKAEIEANQAKRRGR